jgi:tRNA A37 threonylcarbamoyladenosine modification protein TsaB
LLGGLTAEQVAPPGQLVSSCPRPCHAAAGRGLAAWPQIADSLQLAGGQLFADAEPHARDVAMLAVQDLAGGQAWRDASLALPVYLRDQVASARMQL